MMKAFQYYWTFIFLWLLGLSWVIQFPSIASALFVGLLLLRIFYLRQPKIGWVILISTCLLIGRFWLVHQVRENLTTVDIMSDERTYMIEFDPLSIRESDFLWTGRGDAQIGASTIPVEWHLDKADMLELPTQRQRWQVKASMKRPEPARNFHVFDYANYLASQEIYWQLDIKSIQYQTATSNLFDNLRMAFMQPFLACRTIDWVALHNKLLWNLDSQAYRAYRSELVTLGVAHFFAISGFHVHYIRRLLDDLLRRTGITLETERWLLFFLLIFYSWIVHFPIGVVRVIVTFYSTKIVRHYQLPFSSLDVLALTGIALLFWQPQLSVSIGFLLSFLMTYLIHFYSQTLPKQKKRWRVHGELTLTCLLFSWPLLIQQNHEWNGWQFIYVFVFALVFERVLFPLFVVTSLGLWLLPPYFFERVSGVFEGVWQVIEQVTAYLQPVIVGHLPWWQFACLVGIAGYWLHTVHRAPFHAIKIVLLGYGILLWVVPYWNPSASLTVLDVGQGDALLYRPTFSQEAWLFDTGGRPDLNQSTIAPDTNYARRTIIPALKALGVRKLTGVVITHPDLDHIGNLEQLAQAIPIDTLVITPYTQQSAIWQHMLPAISARTQVIMLPFLNQIEHPQLPIQLLTGPDLSETSGMDGANDTSIVARIRIGPVTLLNMGDLSSGAEQVLLQYYPNLAADILKMGHHGSKHSTSEGFLAHIQPKLALISAGYENRYGHPHDETLARLEQASVPYLATNEQGAIQLTYDFLHGLQVRTMLQNAFDK